jgi:putative ABC transport system permease protein
MPSNLILGARALVRRPLSSAASILCLGLGIAASAVALTAIDATAIRPYGLKSADHLVVMWETDRSRGLDLIEVSLPNFLDWERRAASLESMAAFGSSHWPGVGQSGGETFPVAPRAVSVGFFRTLRMAPILGRDFLPADLDASVPPPVVLSHRFWMTRQAGAPNVVGASIFVDGVEHRVIGVMPRGFAFPDAPDVWVSVERTLQQAFAEKGLSEVQQRAIGVLEVIGRLAAGRAREQARAELSGIARALQTDVDGATPSRMSVAVTPFTDVILGRLGPRLWMAVGMAVVVLLFACANAAAVRMAHASERVGELAARLSLGASTLRLARGLVGETGVLFLGSVGMSVLLTLALLASLERVPLVAESGIEIGRHWPVTVAALVVFGALAWLLVAVAPALAIASRLDPSALSQQTRTVARGARSGVRLLAPQAALAICVVGVAGVALEALGRLSRIDVGFSTVDVTAVDVSLPGWKYESEADAARLGDELLASLSALPRASAVAGVSVRPFRFGEIADGLPVRRSEDAATSVDEALSASRVIVTPDYFAAMGIDMVHGRSFTEFDRSVSPTVAVVSRNLARALWGNEQVVGREAQSYTLTRGWQSHLVVGVADAVRSRVLERPSLELYVPHGGGGLPLSSYVIRAEPGAITEAMIRRALHEVEPDLALERVQTTASIVGAVMAPARLLATMMSLLGLSALLLLGLGIFGAAAAVLRASWAEVAVRQAFGATPLQASAAPLRALFRALAWGGGSGLIGTPVLVASMALIEPAGSAGWVVPVAGAGLAVIIAVGLAIWPSLRRTSRLPPGELLRAQ